MLLKSGSILGTAYWEEGESSQRLSTIAKAAKWFVELLRPSILTRSGPRNPARRTAYLDGLRGFAALLVYWMHNQLWAHDSIGGGDIFENAYGYNEQYYFACLPGVRTFFSGGHFAVSVFFVISGYVLSTKPLTLIVAGDFVKLGDNLASALFRRWMRLYIPVIVTTFVYMTLWHAFGIWTDQPHLSTYRQELWSWYAEFKNFSFVFRTGGEPWFTYNVHTWSIQIEFKGSIIIYTALVAFSRCKRNARLWCEVGLIFYFLYITDGWYGSLFIGGMLLSDLDVLSRNNDLPRFFTRLERYKSLIFNTLFIVSIYLGGIPSHTSDFEVFKSSPGWYYLSFLKPQAVFDYKWFYLFWASIFCVASIPRISWLKWFFETPFNQYLGRISFALYLVHGPVIFMLGDRLYAATGWVRPPHTTHLPGWVNIFPISRAGPLGLELSFLVPQMILLPITLWLAEVVTKVVDDPSIRFSQWLYQRTLAPAVKL